MIHPTRILLPALLLTLAACSNNDNAGGNKSGGGSASGGTGTRANTYTIGDQQTPAIARNRNGDRIVVWDSVGQDGSLSGIYGQRYKNGQPAGSEFRVNTYTSNKQNQPAVAMNDSGSFVVVWRSSGQGSDGGTIFGQRYAADGTPAGGEFQIGPDTSNDDSQADPAVAMNDAGSFVVVFSNRELTALQAQLELNASEDRTVQGRLYKADGSAATDVFTIATGSSGSIERSPTVGIDSNGGFVAAWLSDTAPSRIYIRRYDATGAALADKTAINDEVSANDRPAMAMNAAGQFVVTWERAVNEANLTGIYARVFKADGSAAGEPFQVANRDAGFYERPSAAIDGSGNFAISGQSAQKATGSGTYVVRYNAAGAVTSNPALVNDAQFSNMFAKLAMDSSGALSVAWQSYRQDGDGRGVYWRDL